MPVYDLLAEINNISSEFLWQCNAEYRFSFISPNVKKLWGKEVCELLGKSFKEVFDEVTYERIKREFFALEKNEVQEICFEFSVAVDGAKHWLEITAKLTNDPQNSQNKIMGVGRDISLKKEMESTSQNTKQQSAIAAKVASMMEMSRGVAHEINNPLTILTGNLFKLRMLLEKP